MEIRFIIDYEKKKKIKIFTVSKICNLIFLSPKVTSLFRKSMPTVAIKLPARNVPSLNRTNRQVFPTGNNKDNWQRLMNIYVDWTYPRHCHLKASLWIDNGLLRMKQFQSMEMKRAMGYLYLVSMTMTIHQIVSIEVHDIELLKDQCKHKNH